MNDVAKRTKHLERPHRAMMRSAIRWTLFWIISALIFNALLWFYYRYTVDISFANKKGLEFLTGYLIEESLSVDNLFVFYLVFQQLHIPPRFQRRVFNYGIWGAIVMRLGLILLGVWLVTRFHWVLYLMGAFLVLTGLKMCLLKDTEKDLEQTWVMRVAKRLFRVTHEMVSEHFFIKKKHLWYATPLFIALIFVEVSDLIFALDSIPAIFAITTDPFIVWTSNIFAILGLRSLYFLLAGMLQQLHLLKYGIALILVFVGAKMLIEPWLHLSVGISLMVIIGLLLLFSWLSIASRNYYARH